jgi:hypothetical protein
MADARAILRSIIATDKGQPIELSVSRGGDTKDVTVAGQSWPHMMELRSDVLASAESVARAQAQGIGFHMVAITAADRKRLAEDRKHLGALPEGTGVTIDRVTSGSQADTLDLKVGDIIEQVNDRPVKSPADVPTTYGRDDPKTGKMVAMLVRGKERARWVTLFVGHVDVAALLTPPPTPPMQVNSPVAKNNSPAAHTAAAEAAAPNAASQANSPAAHDAAAQGNTPAARDAATGQR